MTVQTRGAAAIQAGAEGGAAVLDLPAADAGAAAAVQDTLSLVRDALAAGATALAYQPVVQAAAPGAVAFHEGLIRLLDRAGRLIPARDFIEAVEPTELGRDLDAVALRLGLQALREHPGLRLSVNMSARSIGCPRWLETLQCGLHGAPTLGERLIVEITETSAMGRPEAVLAFIRSVQEHGIAFALDDFGAGYTSFRHLREFRFDVVKIDGRFVRGVAADADNQVLVRALVMIARQFDMFTVAESVETAEDAAWCAAHGVTCLQGYHFGAPMLRPAWSDPGRLTA